MIDRHQVPRDKPVWAWINGVPTEILFRRLLPYNGFAYWLTTDTEETFAPPAFKEMDEGVTYELRSEREERGEAIFAETREELIRDRRFKCLQKIAELEAERDRLLEMLYPATDAQKGDKS